MERKKNAAADDRDLVRSIKSGGCPQAVEQLFHDYQNFLRASAYKYQSNRLPFEDAYQIAAMGLLKAVERFDPERGTAFMTFAYPTVNGELKKYYRDCVEFVRIPRKIRDLKRLIALTQESLREREGREPTISQVAERLGVAEEDVIEALAAEHKTRVLSLDMELEGEYGEDTLASFLGQQDEGFERMETTMIFEQIMETLPSLMRSVIDLRLAGWTQKMIAKKLNLSQMQVSRLQCRALEMIDESRLLEKEPA
jgi:RNA polymerase sigma-B factor